MEIYFRCDGYVPIDVERFAVADGDAAAVGVLMTLRRSNMRQPETDARRVDAGLYPVAAVELNEHGIVTFWNSAATALLGWSAADAVGRTCFEVFGRELLGNLPSGRQRVRMDHARGTQVEADVIMRTDRRVGETCGHSIVVILPEAEAPTSHLHGDCPPIEPWISVAESMRGLGQDVQCIGVGLVGMEAINKGYSRSTGDAVLTEVAARLRVLAGPNGLTARTAGNHFTIGVAVADSIDAKLIVSALSSAICCPLATVRITGDERG